MSFSITVGSTRLVDAQEVPRDAVTKAPRVDETWYTLNSIRLFGHKFAGCKLKKHTIKRSHTTFRLYKEKQLDLEEWRCDSKTRCSDADCMLFDGSHSICVFCVAQKRAACKRAQTSLLLYRHQLVKHRHCTWQRSVYGSSDGGLGHGLGRSNLFYRGRYGSFLHHRGR